MRLRYGSFLSFLFFLFLWAPLVLLICGCGTAKKLNRETGGFYPKPDRHHESTSSKTFQNGLKLLYETKVMGAADSPIAIGPNWLGLKTTRDRIQIFDRKTGRKRCQIKKKRGMIVNPVFTDSLLILVRKSPLGEIQLLNLFTGKVIGRKMINEIRSGPIITDKGLIYGTATGLKLVEIPELTLKWESEFKGYVDKNSVTRNDTVYCMDGKGTVTALDLSTGGTIWEVDLEVDLAMPMALGNYLFVGSADGEIMALSTDQGHPVWDVTIGYPVRSQPAVSDGNIYFGATDGKIYCLDANSGQKIWDFATEGIVTAAPVITGGSVIIGSHDRHLYNLDRASGNLIDRHRLEGPVTIPVTVGDDFIYVSCRNGRLYCFEGK